MHESHLGPATVERIRAGWRHRLARATLLAMVRGHTSEFRFYIRYLRKVEGVLSPLAQFFLHLSIRLPYRLFVHWSKSGMDVFGRRSKSKYVRPVADP